MAIFRSIDEWPIEEPGTQDPGTGGRTFKSLDGSPILRRLLHSANKGNKFDRSRRSEQSDLWEYRMAALFFRSALIPDPVARHVWRTVHIQHFGVLRENEAFEDALKLPIPEVLIVMGWQLDIEDAEWLYGEPVQELLREEMRRDEDVSPLRAAQLYEGPEKTWTEYVRLWREMLDEDQGEWATVRRERCQDENREAEAMLSRGATGAEGR